VDTFFKFRSHAHHTRHAGGRMARPGATCTL
jgi:hypothetical protein